MKDITLRKVTPMPWKNDEIPTYKKRNKIVRRQKKNQKETSSWKPRKQNSKMSEQKEKVVNEAERYPSEKCL